MSRRKLKDLAQEPLTALSAMAVAALLALMTHGASDAPGVGSASALAAQAPGAAELRAAPGPRLQLFALPSLEDLGHDAADCALAGVRDLTDGQRLFFIQRGA